MSVANLRKKLDERGLDVDGTYEMLVDSLERSHPYFIVEGAGSAYVNGRYNIGSGKSHGYEDGVQESFKGRRRGCVFG
jgi:hypothetical protein